MKEYKNILLLCGVLYMFVLFQMWGIEVPGAGEVREVGSAVTEKEKPKIAITFDDGPSVKYTPQLLDGLKGRNAKASFFVIGELVEKHPEIIKGKMRKGIL